MDTSRANDIDVMFRWEGVATPPMKVPFFQVLLYLVCELSRLAQMQSIGWADRRATHVLRRCSVYSTQSSKKEATLPDTGFFYEATSLIIFFRQTDHSGSPGQHDTESSLRCPDICRPPLACASSDPSYFEFSSLDCAAALQQLLFHSLALVALAQRCPCPNLIRSNLCPGLPS